MQIEGGKNNNLLRKKERYKNVAVGVIILYLNFYIFVGWMSKIMRSKDVPVTQQNNKSQTHRNF